MERLAHLAIRYRGALLGACGGITILAMAGLAQLRFQEEPRDIYRSDNDDFQRLEKVYRDFGADDNDCLILVEADELFTPAASGHLRGLVTQLSELEGVQRVLGLPHVVTFPGPALPRPLYPGPSASPETFEAARRAAHAHPMVGGVMLAPDGRATLLAVRLTGGSLHVTDVEERTGPIRKVLTRWEKASGFKARLTGIPPIRVAVLRLIEKSTVLFTVIGTTCCVLLCFLIFRNLRALLITAAGPILGILWSVGMLGWIGVEMDLVMTVMPTLVMAIGFTDSVHLMVDMRESVAKGKSGPEAARLSIARLGIPCALTSFTTAVGFASLAQAQVGIIQRFGLASMGGVLLTFLAVITCVPLCVSFFPKIIAKRSRETGTNVSGIVKGFTGFILDHPRTWSLAGVLLTVTLFMVGLNLRPDNRLTEALPRNHETFRTLEAIEKSFKGSTSSLVLVTWDTDLEPTDVEVLGGLRDIERELETFPELGRPLSMLNLWDSLPGPDAVRKRIWPMVPPDFRRALVREDLHQALVSIPTPEIGHRDLTGMIDRLERMVRNLETRHPRLDFTLTGTTVVARKNVNLIIMDLVKGLGLASIIIFGVMTLQFRSLKFGAISILPNVFPLVVVAAVMALLDEPLTMVNAVVFTILLGLAVDDTIHMLACFRRELRETDSARVAARRSMRVVGRALVITTSVLIVGVMGPFFSEIHVQRMYALLMTCGLLAALLGDLVFLPALLTWSHRNR